MSNLPADLQSPHFNVFEDSLPERDEPLHEDLGMTSRPSITRKRKRTSSADTAISSVEVLDLTSEPALEDSRSAKRRRSAQPQGESLVSSPVCTPKSTPPPGRGSPISPLRTSNDPNTSNLDGGNKDNDANIPDLPRSDILDSVNGGDSEHQGHGLDTGPLEPLRQSVSPCRRTEGDRHVSEDMYAGEDRSNGSDGEVGESGEDDPNGDQEVSRRAGAATLQRHKRSNRSFQDKRRGPTGTSLERLDGSTRPTRTLRHLKSSPARRHSGSKADIVTRSASLRTSSPGAKVVHDCTVNYGQSDHADYRPTDITLCQVPECTTLVTAIVHWNEITSKLSLKPLTIVRDLLGDAGQLIRMTQLTSDSWLLVGCRYNDTLNVYASPSSTQQSSDYTASKTGTRSPHGKGANNDAVGPDDDEDDNDRDDDFGNGSQSSGSESSGGSDSDASAAAADDGRLHREHRRVQVRTRRPWLESDDRRLLAYKNKMGMKWDDIFGRFPDRTPGAVRAHWHILQGK